MAGTGAEGLFTGLIFHLQPQYKEIKIFFVLIYRCHCAAGIFLIL
jgi:hypothetical protein